jgi:hypothetical protein
VGGREGMAVGLFLLVSAAVDGAAILPGARQSRTDTPHPPLDSVSCHFVSPPDQFDLVTSVMSRHAVHPNQRDRFSCTSDLPSPHHYMQYIMRI